MEFYILKENVRQGPYPLTELASKNITPETMVWSVGFSHWKPAKEVPELMDILSNQPPESPMNKVMPKTWLVESILVTLFCCLPFGIAGIIFAAKVNTLFVQGKQVEAEEASRKAGKWTKIGFFVGLVLNLIAFVVTLVSYFQQV